VRRWSHPDLSVGVLADSMRYDAVGRLIWKLAQGTKTPETYEYDAAGNLRTRVTARGHRITNGYDALNRLSFRVTPSVTYPAETLGTALLTQSDTSMTPAFPRLPLGASHRTIDRDSASFTYDPATGQLWTANNKDARVTRTYFPNGALHTETGPDPVWWTPSLT
jgi:YD repeat-containing protein